MCRVRSSVHPDVGDSVGGCWKTGADLERKRIFMKRILIAVVAATLLIAVAAPAGANTPPTDVAFEVETDLLGAPSPFVAFGPAVDDGLVCASGIVVDASGKQTGFSPTGFNFQGVKHFTCDDGSGEFFINLQARIDFRKGVDFQWNVLRGTEAYEDLHGAGKGVGLPAVPCGDPDLCVLDVYFGGLHID